MTAPDSPEDLIRKWEAAPRPPSPYPGLRREWLPDDEHERWLEREERLDTACTWALGCFALLGLWKAVSILVFVISWLFSIGW